MKTLRLTLLALAACALLVAGCGGDDEPNEQSDAPATTESVPSDAPVETTDTSAIDTVDGGTAEPPASDESGAPDAVTREQAIQACKDAITGVSAELRRDLEEICDQGADGDADRVREQAVEVCRKIVAEQVPEGDAREQALAACERAAP